MTATLDPLDPGTHLCAVHRDPGRRARVAATFVSHALSAGDRLLYVSPDGGDAALLRALPEHVRPDVARASGQLEVSSFAEVYGTRRPDDLRELAEGFRAAAAQSRERGFPGLRVAAEMDQLLPLLGSWDEVLRWERMSTALQREVGVSSVCLYDATLLDDGCATMLVDEHDGVAPEREQSPLARFLAVETPWGLRVSGEVDLSNRELLHRTLVSRAAVTPQLQVDLGGLTFADVGSLVQLCAVAAALPDTGRLTLTSVPTTIRRTLSVSGLRHERLRLET